MTESGLIIHSKSTRLVITSQLKLSVNLKSSNFKEFHVFWLNLISVVDIADLGWFMYIKPVIL